MAHDSRGTSGATSLWRFTLRQFLTAIAFIALGCVALRSASTWWVSGMLGLTLFILTASLLLVVYRRDADRAWWAGFAAFGWAYVLVLILGWSMDKGPLRTAGLVTDKLSRAAHGWLYSEASTVTMTGAYYGPGSYGSIGYGTSDGSAMGYAAATGMGGEGGSSMSGPPGSAGMPPAYGLVGPTPAPAFTPPSPEHFANVGHALWTLVLAFCGGWLARLIYATQPRNASVSSP